MPTFAEQVAAAADQASEAMDSSWGQAAAEVLGYARKEQPGPPDQSGPSRRRIDTARELSGSMKQAAQAKQRMWWFAAAGVAAVAVLVAMKRKG